MSNKETELEKRLKDAIDKHNFSPFEIMGMSSNPRLALFIGAAIGYKLAFQENQDIKYDN